MHVVYETLADLGVVDKETVTLFNKADQLEEIPNLRDFKSEYRMNISAKYGTGLEELKSLLEEILLSKQVYLERVYGYSEAGKIQLIRKYGQLISEEFLEEGVAVKAYVPMELCTRVEPDH